MNGEATWLLRLENKLLVALEAKKKKSRFKSRTSSSGPPQWVSLDERLRLLGPVVAATASTSASASASADVLAALLDGAGRHAPGQGGGAFGADGVDDAALAAGIDGASGALGASPLDDALQVRSSDDRATSGDRDCGWTLPFTTSVTNAPCRRVRDDNNATRAAAADRERAAACAHARGIRRDRHAARGARGAARGAARRERPGGRGGGAARAGHISDGYFVVATRADHSWRDKRTHHRDDGSIVTRDKRTIVMMARLRHETSARTIITMARL